MSDYHARLSNFTKNKLAWFSFEASDSTWVHLHLSWSPEWFQGRLLKIVCCAGQLRNVLARCVVACPLLTHQTWMIVTLLFLKWPWTPPPPVLSKLCPRSYTVYTIQLWAESLLSTWKCNDPTDLTGSSSLIYPCWHLFYLFIFFSTPNCKILLQGK